ncbi:HAD hydrolase family protein [Pseudomonas cerasi]
MIPLQDRECGDLILITVKSSIYSTKPYNDLSMLETVGLGVAMGNADEAIKARVKRVIGTNLETGIADTLYKEVL